MTETLACRDCGQTFVACAESSSAPVAALCDACRPSPGRDERHDVVPLFEAPQTMRGQLGFGDV